MSNDIEVFEGDEDDFDHEARLREMRGWEFEIDGGEQNANGKNYWPDYVTVRIPRKRALLIMEELANQLQQTGEGDFLTLYQFGHLFRVFEE